MKKNRITAVLQATTIIAVLWTLSAVIPAQAVESVCAAVKIEIRQELTLERQAFDAFMRINNGLDTIAIENVDINVIFEDELGLPVLASSDPNNPDAKFFITESSLTGISDIHGTGSIAPNTSAEVHWLIIPAPGAAADTPTGKLYMIGARLSYYVGGVEEVVNVAPDGILVKPMPELALDYFLTRQVYADDPFTTDVVEPPEPFTLGVRIRNNGTGVAKQVALDTAQPTIIENDQQLLIDFTIISSEVNGQGAEQSLTINFGDIDPQGVSVGRWQMLTTLPGQFTDFTATVAHADELGGQLTSLIPDNPVTHDLIRDVLVDLPGRDGVRDFLADDGATYRVYESSGLDTIVDDVSVFANLTFSSLSGTEEEYRLDFPATGGFAYVKLADPLAGAKALLSVRRSDGKLISSDNYWLSKERAADNINWDYYVNFFDINTGGKYAATFDDRPDLSRPPVWQNVAPVVTYEGASISLNIYASDPDGDILTLSALGLPVGATFIDNGNGTGNLSWVPPAAGQYYIRFQASDSVLTTTTLGIITVHPAWDTDGDGMDDAWELEHFGNLDRDGTGDFDGDGVSDLQEYLDGTNPLLVLAWDAPASVDTASTDATNPQIVIAEDGSAISVWSQSDGLVTSIWANSYTPATGWGLTPELLEIDDTGNAHSPRIVLDTDGNAMTIWLQSDGTRDNLWGNYYTNGVGWGVATLIENDNIGDANYAQVVMAPDGTAIALWSQADGTLDGYGQALANTVMSSRYIVGSGWGVPVRIDSYTPIHAFATQLSIDALGNAMALWSDTSDGVTYNISNNEYVSGVGWGTSALLRAGALGDVDASPQVSASLAMNANGDAVAVWAEASSPASVWASVYPSGTAWGAATLLETSLDAAIEPVVAIDSAGNAIAAFAQFDGSRYVVHANRYSAGVWGVDALVGTTSTTSLNGDATAPQITVDSTGDATVVWQQFDGVQSNIWANRFDGTSITWDQPLVIETENTGNADKVQIAMNSIGEAVVVWQQADGTSINIQSNTYEPDNFGVPDIAPIAFTATDITADEQTTVILDGSASFDQDGSIANYAWTQISGTTVTLDTSTTATSGIASFVTPTLTASEALVFQLTVTDDASNTGTVNTTVTVNPVNALPTSNAGLDQNVDEQILVTLSGSGSDSDGNVASYSWTQTGGSAVTLTGAATANAGFTSPIVLAPVSPETLTFDLAVTDNEGGITTDSITITVNAVNTNPTANAGIDQSVDEQTAVSLTGSGSDSDGTVASYSWTQTSGSVVTLTGASTANASFTSPIVLAPVSPETLMFDLTVTDNEGGITTDTIIVTVNAVNASPTANAGIAQSVDEQTVVALSGSGNDSDGSVASYAWTQTGGSAVTLTGAATANASFTSPIVLAPVSPEFLTFELSVTDNEDGVTTDSIIVSVNAVNVNPVSDAGIDQSVDEQTAVALVGSGSDADGSVATYNWTQTGGSAVTLTGAATANASFTAPIVLAPVSPDTLTFELSVTDNEGGVTNDSITITVNAVNTNPTANAGIDQSVDEQSAVALVGSGSDADGSVASYAWTQTSGTAVTLTGADTATASFTAPIVLAPVSPETLTFDLTVTDNEGGVTTDSIIITVNAVNTNPTADAGVDQSVDEQTLVNLAGLGTDSDGSVASYAWSQTGGSAVTLTGAATANASFTAPIVLAPVSPETLTFDLTVTDNEGGVTTDTIVVTVNAVNAAPTADAGIDLSVDEQTAVALVGSGSDTDGSVASYAWSQAGGTAVTLTGSDTANASFTSPIVLAPVSPELLTFDLTVTDNEGGVTTDTIVITVNGVNVNPVSDAGIDQSVDEQTVVDLTGGGSDSDGSVASYAWTQTGGTSVTLTGAETSTASFTSPVVLAPVSPELLTFDLTVTDNEGGITTDSITITVNAVNANPTANAGIDQSVDEQTAVALAGSGTDSDGTVDSYAWTQTGGTSVTLTGADTANASFTAPIVLAPVSPETLTFDLAVTDNEGGITTDSITITVNAVNTNPTANAGIDQSVDEQTAVSLTGSGTDSDGTVASYSWVQTGGSPVTLTGAATANASFTAPIVLAPVNPETLTFDLTVTDNEGGITIDTIVVTVNAVNTNPTADAGVDQSVEEQTLVNLTGSGSDSDGIVAGYSWTQTSGTVVTLTGASTANASFTSPMVPEHLNPELLMFDLAVMDNEGGVTTDAITVVVYVLDTIPPTTSIIIPLDNSSYTSGDSISFNGSASDVEDGDISSSLQWASNLDGPFAPLDPSSFSINWLSTGTHTITATVTDSSGLSPVTPASITIDVGSAPSSGDRITDGLKAEYRFTTGVGSVVYDKSGEGVALDLQIQDAANASWLVCGGLSVTSPTAIIAGATPAKITAAIKASNAASIEAWVKPDNTSQFGPARIVTLSNGLYERNFTLGQEYSEYDVRFRTTTTSDNGLNSTTTNSQSVSTQLTHVLYTRDATGLAAIYVNGMLATSVQVGGDTDYWDDNFVFGLVDEVGGYRSWLGELHLVAVYDRALSASEVQQNYTTGTYNTCSGLIANAGADQTVVLGDVIQLDGSGSSVPEGELLNYAWSVTGQPLGSNAIFTDATVVNPTLAVDQSGVYTIALIVNDGVRNSVADRVTVNVIAPVPVATPVFTPVGGSYMDSVTITLDTATTGATIYFSTDGSEPSSDPASSSIVYGGAFRLLQSATVKAIALADGYQDSTVSTVTYNIITAPSNSDRITDGLKAEYRFTTGVGSVVYDKSGEGVALDLQIQDVANTSWLQCGGLSVTSPTAIIASATPAKITAAIKASNAASIEAWVKPDNTSQFGSARIVTLSNGLYDRNFTLGQEYSEYDVRFRTTTTSSNGLDSTITYSQPVSTQLTHVLYTRDATGLATIYVDGMLVESVQVDGDTTNWNDSFVFGLVDEVGGYRSWLGELHLVAIYDRALSASEVQQNYTTGTYNTCY